MPANTFIYFAYGSNMLSCRLKKRTPSAESKGTGFVKEYRLTFDKKSTDGSGKCDIEFTGNPDDRVYGVLFEIALAEKKKLDDAEKGYTEKPVEVVTSEGTRNAKTYIAESNAKNSEFQPYHWYKDMVVKGAEEHRLPNDYIDKLRNITSQEDPNIKRREENERLLSDN